MFTSKRVGNENEVPSRLEVQYGQSPIIIIKGGVILRIAAALQSSLQAIRERAII